MTCDGRSKINVVELFGSKQFLNVCAPMVRYSKLEFRSLVRKYNCDLCFTPMIMSDSFVQSTKARDIEFTTSEGDSPLIVQFAANNVRDFVTAAELISPFADGVDLNCGCPQRWAMQDGYGAHLLSKPQLIKDIVSQTRNRIPSPFSVSVKIRIDEDIRTSVQLCQDLEAAGVSFLTVHGRTIKNPNGPVNLEAIRQIVASTQIPIIGNGGITRLKDVETMNELTSCKGVMAAQGLLDNPTLFLGTKTTPISCVQDWIDVALHSGMTFQCFHHHLVFMLSKTLPKEKRLIFNRLRRIEDVTEFLTNELNVNLPSILDEKYRRAEIKYSDDNGGGKFFKSFVKEKESSDMVELSEDSWLFL